MHLEKITAENMAEAVRMARTIFPYEVHKEGFWPELAYRESIALKRPNFAYYIAYVSRPETNGCPVGITGHYPPTDRHPSTLWLGWFGILPLHRRKGFGAQMLQLTCKTVATFGCDEIKLYSGDREEERAAHRLYERHGFQLSRFGKVDGQPVRYYRAPLPLSVLSAP